MVVLVTIVLSTFGLLVSLSAGIHPQHDGAFKHVARDQYVPTYDPIALAKMGLPPDTSAAEVKTGPAPASPEVRAIVIYPDHINLLAAGKTIRSIEGEVRDMRGLQLMLKDSAWLDESSSGKFTLKAALITTEGTRLTLGSPYVSELRMLDQPSVFIGTHGGTLVFDGVTVRAVPGDTENTSRYQPFVMATDNAVLNTYNSRFTNLGWDWNASYGVSWEENSTGQAIDTSFDHSFIGVYTGRCKDLVFRGSTFSHNKLYGLDPHTYSTNLTIDRVRAEHNGAHGIIFSDHVTGSSITNSVSRHNGENGIMMDEYSTGNTITGNTVTSNTGDGLVTAESSNNAFSNNRVSDNRVGVRVDPKDAASTTFSGNRITSNGLGAENITLNGSNTVTGNGGQWNIPVLQWTWATVLGLVIITMLTLAYANRRNKHKQRPAPQPGLHAVA